MTLTSEVFIQATETDPAIQARAVIHTAHRQLLTGLRPKVALLTELELSADARESALATLTDFCTGPVRRHLNATDQALRPRSRLPGKPPAHPSPANCRDRTRAGHRRSHPHQ